MMTITDYVARQTIRIAEAMAHFIETTAPERLDWHPAIQASDTPSTRSILEQVGECVQVNHLIARLLRGETAAPTGSRQEIAFADGADARRQLLASAEELAEAIRGVSDADLERVFPHPRAPMRGENLILACYRNMAYHAGQINFIQTLYGDTEFHLPPNWR
jgi:hypothetical protein